MRFSVALLILGLPAFLLWRTPLSPWRPPALDPVDAAFERVDAAQRPFASRRAEDFGRLPADYEQIVALLPVGYWSLLIDAYPDRAFARYAPLHSKSGDVLARWALVRLAEQAHGKTLEYFRARLDSPDSYERGLAVRMLAHGGDPTLIPRLLGMLPKELKDADDGMMAADLLRTICSCRPSDPEPVDDAVRRFEKMWKDTQEGGASWYTANPARFRFDVATASDPAQAVGRVVASAQKLDVSLESFEEWLPAFAVRYRVASLAPVLRQRVRAEFAKFVADEREDELYPAERGTLNPQLDAAWGFRGPFLLAPYRRALRDLGVPLTREERDWLEAHHLLRPPREYLIEAGVLPPSVAR